MHSDLIAVIRQVRRRWRFKLALRGAAGVLGLGLLVLLAGAFGLEAARFSSGAIVTFRIVTIAAFLALMAFLLVRPLIQRVSDEQVALYLEEHEPSLQAEIISAVEASRVAESSGAASVLVRRLVESAIEKCRAIDEGRRVERAPLRQYALTLGAVAVVAFGIFTFGPAYLRHALSALVDVSRSVEAAVPYRIDVTPGNATVPRGVDQTVTANLSGFDTDRASLMVRKTPDAAFERLPLVRGDDGKFEGILFDLSAAVDYFVEASGVRSPVFTLKVVELPYVQKIELEFHFPAYTGLAPQKVEDGGDIAVLRGTEVRVKVVPTMASSGGQIVLDDKSTAPLAAAADGALTTKFKVERDGFYHVELDAPNGERVSGSPKYTIDILTDLAPTVSIAKPGRDTSASPIEEVFVEARAEDDYGVRDLDLVYSVNGGTEKTVRLFDGKSRLAEVTAGHTLYLEELNVQPGDSVSYYARAADNDAVAGKKVTTSDIYFLRVRPLSKEFRRAQSDAGAGGGGGGGGGGEVGALSDQQRKIIAATFNIQRDRKKLTAEKVRENSVVVGLSQARLREQVDGLLTRMNSRLVEQDPRFKKVAELLPQAANAMKEAEKKLQAISPEGALAPEQTALQFLQKAEEEYELQVQMGRQQGGGGGGGGQSSMAQDLADLFEMELDKMANQYETRQQASQQQSDQQVDELAEKLKELARRQEQEAERQRRRAALGQQQSGGGAGDQQRALADQVEEAARRLEQLSREQNRSDLQQSARQLRQAADAMRRAAAGGQQASGAQAAEALDKLREAQRQLQQSQSGRAERDVRDALRRSQELAQDQKQIADDTKNIDAAGDRRQEQIQQLSERKRDLESRVGEFEKQLDRTAAEIRRDERQAARKVEEAANTIRDTRVRDKIRYSGSMLRQGAAAEAQNFDAEVGENLRSLTDKLSQAASALGRPDPANDALERARNLARGVESLEQRMRERADQRAQGQQGQQSARPGSSDPAAQQGQQSGRPGSSDPGAQQGQQSGRPGSSDPSAQQGQQSGRPGSSDPGAQQGQQSGRPGSSDPGAQQGQQGGQGGRNDGARTNDGRGGEGDTVGRWREDGGWGSRRPGRYTSDDVRQFRNEVRQWTNEAQQLRRLVQGQKIDPKELDEILKGLRALDDDRVYQNVSELERLQSFVTEGLKRFEYNLRRKSELKGNEAFVAGGDNVPEEFRKKVEEYYKSLAIKK